jgi:hypothetical protein
MELLDNAMADFRSRYPLFLKLMHQNRDSAYLYFKD